MARKRGRLARQHKERGLKGILGIGKVRQNTPAYPQDHRAMAVQQRCKSGLVPIAREAEEEFSIGDVIETPRLHEPVQMIQQDRVLSGGHTCALVGSVASI
jgi:hypothetical protein